MKQVILSFDDGRKDNYTVAWPLLRKYDLTASMHIVTGFVDGSKKASFSLGEAAMNIENIKELASNGIDISSHGDEHINDENDLKQSIQKLKQWGILNGQDIVFSSPNSEIYEGNIAEYLPMLKHNDVCCVRSGVQVRRNGLLYSFCYMLQMITKSKFLYYILNKDNIMTETGLKFMYWGGGGWV
ncbi:MAG: polysaccharide deacetylase family protein [Bacteroidales bacterium]|nr:polysaccharide deacetylase family protein [Bacteroidales bacterium]